MTFQSVSTWLKSPRGRTRNIKQEHCTSEATVCLLLSTLYGSVLLCAAGSCAQHAKYCKVQCTAVLAIMRVQHTPKTLPPATRYVATATYFGVLMVCFLSMYGTTAANCPMRINCKVQCIALCFLICTGYTGGKCCKARHRHGANF